MCTRNTLFHNKRRSGKISMTVRKLGGGVMALYDITARLIIDSLIYLDESDFKNEEEIKEAIYEYVLESLYYSWTKVEE